MFKDGYKIILIKEGKFNLKQFSVTPFHITLAVVALLMFTSSFFFIFSDQLVKWAGSREIEKHRKNNQVLVKTIEENQARINNLLDELEEIKHQDDILRKLVKLPPIHEDIRKMGFGGAKNKSKSVDINYLLPDDDIDLIDIENGINYVNRLINLELLSYKELAEKVKSNLDEILAYPAIFPVKNGSDELSSNFGYRRDPFSNKYKFHDGHDYSSGYCANGDIVSFKIYDISEGLYFVERVNQFDIRLAKSRSNLYDGNFQTLIKNMISYFILQRNKK